MAHYELELINLPAVAGKILLRKKGKESGFTSATQIPRRSLNTEVVRLLVLASLFYKCMLRRSG